MRLLVLGGTRFLSRSVAEQAVARGWEVTAACRGTSGPLPAGVTHLPWDRSSATPAPLVEGQWDAVVDVSRTPSHVRRAVAAVPDAHWVFVSTVNVYADNTSSAMSPLVSPTFEDVDLAEDPEAYGPMKVACEEIVASGVASSALVRPGLIVGPGDPSGRFPYWPHRFARGGSVLAPGSPEDVVQVIDVRDLADWILSLCESRTSGAFDGVGAPTPLREVLAAVAAGVGGPESTLTWVDADFLASQGVEPWAGEDAIPLWLPRPEYDGMLAHDHTPAVETGLRLRPIAETARDSLADPGVGITPEREAELLAAWAARG
jgi:nucleoside-diphosphate-sugar epimerase